MSPSYAIGLDYGTNSVRALLVDAADGHEIAESVWNYEHGDAGVILAHDPNLARQHPSDYIKGAEQTIKRVVTHAKKTVRKFRPEHVAGIGVDTTGSTPLPVDAFGQPLAFDRRFSKNPNALAWLWKDHTASAEALEITSVAGRMRRQYLAKCGGAYSSEWFFSKILHCLRRSPDVFKAAHSWVELADYIPAALTGTEGPEKRTAGICAAGHKAMYNSEWGGYPDAEFLARLDPKMAELRGRLCPRVRAVDRSVGGLTPAWAKKTGLRAGLPVAVGAFDAHLGAVGCGITPGTLVKIIGTSTCDIAIAPNSRKLPEIPGLCGVVDGSVLAGFFGLEAGQSAVGDIFNWFVNCMQMRSTGAALHEKLSRDAARLRPGESGLLALDWNNGNRTILVDQRLTGLLLGQTLYTRPAEIYRALVEATAFGALIIINRLEEFGIPVDHIVNCGGIAEKNPLVMQIYADVTGRTMKVSRSAQTCALGAAIAGAVVGGKHSGFATAMRAMSGLKREVFRARADAHAVYQELFSLYSTLHDAFGSRHWTGNLHNVMKKLIEIRARARNC